MPNSPEPKEGEAALLDPAGEEKEGLITAEKQEDDAIGQEPRSSEFGG
jgi:hypothetical protein